MNASAKPVFHALFNGEKFSDMVAHFGSDERIQDDTSVHLTEFEERLVRKTGYQTLAEAEEDMTVIFKEDESKRFAVLFENANLFRVYDRNHLL